MPILAPVADKMGIDLVWFGVILALNLQTSFLTPPFGFALFYLRSVAANVDYKECVTGATIRAVTTTQIYKGSIAFIILQLCMVAAVEAFPTLVTGGIEDVETIDADKALESEASGELDLAATESGCGHGRPARVSWARLLKRVPEIDIQPCPNCGRQLKIIAANVESAVIEQRSSRTWDCGPQGRASPRTPARDRQVAQAA